MKLSPEEREYLITEYFKVKKEVDRIGKEIRRMVKEGTPDED